MLQIWIVSRNASHLPAFLARVRGGAPLHLSEAGEDSRAHDFDTGAIPGITPRVVRTHEAKLHGKPIYVGQLHDGLVGRAERGQADLLRELGEVGVREKRHVADELVADVGLRRVEGVAAVPDVLRAAEGAERQRVQEVPRRKEAAHRAEPEAGLVHQVVRDVAELRDLLRAVAGLGLQLGQDLVELLARPLGVVGLQLLVDSVPDPDLLLRVLHPRKPAVALFVAIRELGQFVPPLFVGLVVESRMVRGEQASRVRPNNLLHAKVDLLARRREPRHVDGGPDLDVYAHLSDVGDGGLHAFAVGFHPIHVELDGRAVKGIVVQL
mmetsp:Transcript_72199/g.181985  ORF Transcript_72199/g.181985 Transcript_72199/m.181985 type:complete len:324 (-) Transcript_72199:274-1245(-)